MFSCYPPSYPFSVASLSTPSLFTSLLPSLFPCCPCYSLFINSFPFYVLVTSLLPPCYPPCFLAALSILFLSTPFLVTLLVTLLVALLPFLFSFYRLLSLLPPCYPSCFLTTLSIAFLSTPSLVTLLVSLLPFLFPYHSFPCYLLVFFVLRKSLLLTPCYCLSPCWPVTLLAFWVLINLLWLYS